MPGMLIDTNILIDYLRGKADAVNFLTASFSGGNIIYCSVITRIELISGLRPGEELIISRLLDTFEEIEVTRKIADIAGKYMNLYSKSHGIFTPDAIIAASAKYTEAVLYTLNGRHFPMKDISVKAPCYPP